MYDQRIPSNLFTVAQFSSSHPFLSPAALRFLIYRSKERIIRGHRVPANGLAPALHRFGRRIYIDAEHLIGLIAASSQAPSAPQVRVRP